MLHSYRYRVGAAAGDPMLNEIVQRLSAEPRITAPAILLEGADDGVDPGRVAPHFSALRRRAVMSVGHNIRQEAPAALADAALELSP